MNNLEELKRVVYEIKSTWPDFNAESFIYGYEEYGMLTKRQYEFLQELVQQKGINTSLFDRTATGEKMDLI